MAPTEETALDTLRLFFSRRGLPTDTTRITTDDVEKANLYTIGKVLVIFNQKQTTSIPDIGNYRKFAAENAYAQGMVVVSRSKPSDNALLAMKAVAKDRVQFFYLPELQYDITQSRWSMPHRILKPDEVTVLLKEKNITKPEVQLLSIDSQDIQARIVGAIPGDVVEVIRHSDTAGQSKVWRYCVTDANIV
jgi:DNA-directed RNA polymerase subunit H (RpoH/RPB5)